MGFKGQKDNQERTQEDVAEEAKNIMILAHKMMKVIEEERKKTSDHHMNDLSL